MDLGMHRHHIFAKRQLDGKGIAGALLDKALIAAGNVPPHHVRNQRQGLRRRLPVPDRPVPCIADMGGKGECPGHRRGDDLLQRLGQLLCAIGGQETAAGFLGDTLHLHQGLGLALDVETDDMGGEVDARLCQRPRGRAGIGVAGLDPVRDQNDRSGLFRVAQRLGGSDDGIGHRGHAARVQFVDDLDDFGRGSRRRLDDGLDIGAVAAFAMAIGDEAQILLGGEIGQNIRHHLAGDGDLVHAVDLAPHRTRGIQHQDGAGPFLRDGGQAGGTKGQGRDGSFQKKGHAVSPWDEAGAVRAPEIRPLSLRKCEDICSSLASHSGSGRWPSIARK